MKLYKEIEQGTEEWFEIRKGKMTASNAQCIGANGKGLETYIYTLLAEKYSNNKEIYTNKDMERGIELEEQARMVYEIEFESVEQIGFCEMSEYVGASPDGLMDKKGLEIKCPNDTNYFKILINGEKEIDQKYLWQCQMNMLVCEKDEWDIAFYNPNFNKGLTVFTLKKNLMMQEKLIMGIEKGEKLIKSIETQYANRNL